MELAERSPAETPDVLPIQRKRGRPRKVDTQVAGLSPSPAVMMTPTTDLSEPMQIRQDRPLIRKIEWIIRRWLAKQQAENRQAKADARKRDLAKTDAERSAEHIRAKMAPLEAQSHLGLLAISAAILLLAYKGLTSSIGEGGLTFFAKGEAAIVAIAIAVTSQLGWGYFFKIVPELSGRRLAAALLAASLFLGAVVAIDGRFNMIGMAGDQAAQMSFVEVSSSYEARLRAVLAQAAAARQLLPAIRAQASRFKAASEAELKGAFTGSARPGAVSASYGLVGGQLAQLGSDIGSGLREIEALETQATALLVEMKKGVFDEGAVRTRARSISGLADRLDAIMGQILQRDFRVSIGAVLGAVEKSIAVPKPGAAGLTKVQEAQLGLANETVRPAAETLRAGLKTLEQTGALPAVKRPEGAGQAIFTHWRALLGQWIASVFLDVAPCFLLGILIAARRQAEWVSCKTLKEPQP